MTKKDAQRFVLSRTLSEALLPFVAALPPILGTLATTKDPTGLPDWLVQWLQSIIAANPWIIAASLLWPAIVVVAGYVLSSFREWLEDDGEPTAQELLVFLNCLETPIGRKLKRFGLVAGRLWKSGAKEKPTSIFREITQPKEQIDLLMEGLHLFFQHGVEKKEQLKVTLAAIKAGKFHEFACYLPHSETPRTSAEVLRQKHSSISRAIEIQDLLIIPDIVKELKKKAPQFAQGNVPEVGSMICYPIVDKELGGAIPLVITVKYSEPNFFTDDSARRYRYVLQAFATRIAMENRLLIIKEATNN